MKVLNEGVWSNDIVVVKQRNQPTAMQSMCEKQEADKECVGLQCIRKMRLDNSAYRDI